jgi:hypothetical protein
MPCTPLLIRRRQYRTLDEDERDPEGGSYTPTAASAGGGGDSGPFAPPRGALGGGGGGAANATVELGAINGQVKSIEMGASTNRGDYPRGLTTPQKLQRSASNSEEAAAVAAALGGNSTPRNAGAQSPLRSTAPRQGL